MAGGSSHRLRCDTVAASMELNLYSQKIGDIVVIRCQGRIVVGAEISTLQLELEKLTQLTKKVVLQLGEVSFIDSVGLGALVRQFGVLQAKGGDLKLCQVSPFLLKVLQVTNLFAYSTSIRRKQKRYKPSRRGRNSMKRHSEIRERESSVSIPPTICWRISAPCSNVQATKSSQQETRPMHCCLSGWQGPRS